MTGWDTGSFRRGRERIMWERDESSKPRVGCFRLPHQPPQWITITHVHAPLVLPWWLHSKDSVCQCRSHGFNPWVRNTSWKRKWQLTWVFLPKKYHGQRTLGGLLFMGSQKSPTWLSDSIQFSSVAQSCPTLCDPMNRSTPGLPVHHQLPEFTQTHVHWVGDAIQPSHPLSSPSPLTFNLSQHQGLFQWVNSSREVAKVLEFQLQHQSFQWIFRTDFL